MQYPKNLVIGHLNINHPRNKIVELREYLSLEYFVVSETKLGSSFPSAQVHIDQYEVRVRRDRENNEGLIIELARKGFICEQMKKLEPKSCEAIFTCFTILKKIWICLNL